MHAKIPSYRKLIFLILLVALLLGVIGWGIIQVIEHTVIGFSSELPLSVGTGDPTNPNLVIVNATQPLTEDYVPDELIEVDYETDYPIQLQSEAAEQLERMLEKAESQGIDLTVISGYRSYADQNALNQNALAVNGGNLYGLENSAAGTSEHQTGLAIDLSSPEINNELRQDFALTEAGQWVFDNAATYGFILRYPRGKEAITGDIYEPYHFRYVGIDDARKIADNGLALEEYVSTGVLQEGETDAGSADTNESNS